MGRASRSHAKGSVTFEYVSQSVEETQALGERLGRLLEPGDVLGLDGELGSGKTTLVQGIARGLDLDPGAVKSPTFVLMHEHAARVPLIHLDGYRLEGEAAAAALDVELMFSPHKATVIEWVGRFAGLLPEAYLDIRLSHVSAHRRRLTFVPHGARPTMMVEQLQAQGAPDEAARD